MSHLPFVRAHQMIEFHSLIVAHGNGVDVYYMPALSPFHVKKEIGQDELYTGIIVLVLEDPRHSRVHEIFYVQGGEIAPQDRLDN